MTYLAPIVSALVSLLSLMFMLSGKFDGKIQDVPNERSLHTNPLPRMGGIGLVAGAVSGWVLTINVLTWWLLLPLVILFLVSLLDDMRDLSVRVRLLAQLLAAAILVVGSDMFVQQGAVVALLLLLLTVWVVNLYNFMDGSDGLAGGMALFGFAMYGFAALMQDGDVAFAGLNFSISAAALGFLVYNFAPAKIFMGDAGSISLGFLAVAMGIWGWQMSYWQAWFPLLVFSPFIVDATVTLIKRAMRGARVTEAHCEHYYQRAIQLGWGHRKLALIEYVLMLGAGISSLCALWKEELLLFVLMGWATIYIVMMIWLDKCWTIHVSRQTVDNELK
ncbi:MAG: glycosyltransferase family 4 protein [Gallionella sp.]|nr:glycosyltransferase family 4 protein [Gallionella sp.]